MVENKGFCWHLTIIHCQWVNEIFFHVSLGTQMDIIPGGIFFEKLDWHLVSAPFEKGGSFINYSHTVFLAQIWLKRQQGRAAFS